MLAQAGRSLLHCSMGDPSVRLPDARGTMIAVSAADGPGADLLGLDARRPWLPPKRCSPTPPTSVRERGHGQTASLDARDRPRAARDPRARLACDLCRGDPPARRLCGAHGRTAGSARSRSCWSASALGEYPGADRRRHPDEPGRDRAPRRSRPRRQAVAARFDRRCDELIATGNTARDPRPPRSR